MTIKSKAITVYFLVGIFIVFYEPPYSTAREVPDWARNARIVGVTYETIEDAREMIDWAANSGASVIDIDVDLNNTYTRFMNPDEGIELLKVGCDLAHERGLHVFAYLSGFEIITPNVLDETGQRKQNVPSAYSEHPDWLQVDQNGNPAVFWGSVAFWLEEKDESAWVTPLNPEWHALYLQSVSRVLRETAVDGIFIDVPVFMTGFDGWEDRWPSFDAYMREGFEKYGGQWPVEVGNFDDENFRLWISFRYQAVLDFLRAVKRVIKEIRPEVLLINENYPGGRPEAVSQAGDPYHLITVCDLVTHEWEPQDIDALNRKEYGWLFYTAGIRFFRELDNYQPTWILSYVNYEDDPESMDGSDQNNEALLNLAAATIMAGANFWECGGNNMIGTSTNLELRTRLFQWLAENEQYFYDPNAKIINAVGIYFSPVSRDYADEGGWGIHTSACYGLAMALMENHVNFKFVTPRNIADTTPAEISHLVMANVCFLSDNEQAGLTKYVNSGGKILSYESVNKGNISARAGKSLVDFQTAENAVLVRKNSDPGNDYFYATIYSKNSEDCIYPDYPVAEAEKACRALHADLAALDYAHSIGISAPKSVVCRLEITGTEERIFLTNLNGVKNNNAPDSDSPVTITYHSKEQRFIEAIPFYGDSPAITHSFDADTGTGTISIATGSVWRGVIIRMKLLSDNSGAAPAHGSLPKTFDFLKAYPNPVQCESGITFILDLKKFHPTRLVIYDLMGRRVKIFALQNDDYITGRISWDLTNTDNRIIANGVYFISLENCSNRYLRKMIVLN